MKFFIQIIPLLLLTVNPQQWDSTDQESLLIETKARIEKLIKSLQNSQQSFTKYLLPYSKIHYVKNPQGTQPASISPRLQYTSEQMKQILSKSLRSLNQQTQPYDEKNFDLQTKLNIIRSKTKTLDNEISKSRKNLKDQANANDLKQSELKVLGQNNQKISDESNQGLSLLIRNLKNYLQKVSSFTVNDKVFENEYSNLLDEVKLRIDAIDAQEKSNDLARRTDDTLKYISVLKSLSLFASERLKGLKDSSDKALQRIDKLKENRKALLSSVLSKKEKASEMIGSTRRLAQVRKDYMGILLKEEEKLNGLKLRKQIISENIGSRLKERALSSQTIEPIIEKLERTVIENDPDVLRNNQVLKSIRDSKGRIENMLRHENLILVSNKLRVN